MTQLTEKQGIQNAVIGILTAALTVTVALLVFQPSGIVGRRIAEYRASRAMMRRIGSNWEEASRAANKYEGERRTITLLEVVDYECPYCRHSHPAMSRFLEDTNAGGVGFLQYPLESIHPSARLGGVYALCAAEQGRFREANDYLFTHTEWMDTVLAIRVARQVGVPSFEAFATCVKAPRTIRQLDLHRQIVEDMGVSATPAIVTKGGIRVGEFTYEELTRLLEVAEGRGDFSMTASATWSAPRSH